MESPTKKRDKQYRGVLKARISKIYGGDVTIEKARKLKARPNATPRDKQLANWFINMQTNRPSPAKRKDPLVGVRFVVTLVIANGKPHQKKR